MENSKQPATCGGGRLVVDDACWEPGRQRVARCGFGQSYIPFLLSHPMVKSISWCRLDRTHALIMWGPKFNHSNQSGY